MPFAKFNPHNMKIFLSIILASYYCYPYFTKEEAKTQSYYVKFRSHTKQQSWTQTTFIWLQTHISNPISQLRLGSSLTMCSNCGGYQLLLDFVSNIICRWHKECIFARSIFRSSNFILPTLRTHTGCYALDLAWQAWIWLSWLQVCFHSLIFIGNHPSLCSLKL